MLINASLTEEQLESYKKEGMLHLRGVIPEAMLKQVQLPLEGWVNRKINSWFRQGMLTEKYQELPFNKRMLVAWNNAGQPAYEAAPTDGIVSEEMFNFMRYPLFVQIAQNLTGDNNLAIHGSFHCRSKLPDQKFTDTPWHQDAQCQPLIANTGAVIMWVPLMDVNEDNACLAFNIGGHKRGLYPVYKDPNGYYVSMHPDDCKNLQATVLPMKRGDLLCFNEMVPHRATLNKTDAARWSIDFRFEKIGVPGSTALKKGFICSNDDATKIETSYERWLEEKWLKTSTE